jgi:hypothetical protein
MVSAVLLVGLAGPAVAFTTSATGATPTINYVEPTAYTSGLPITDLTGTRIYWRIGTGPETMVPVLPSKATGGGVITFNSILMPILPCTTGTINVAITATVASSPTESARLLAAPLFVDRTKEATCTIPAPPTAPPGGVIVQ